MTAQRHQALPLLALGVGGFAIGTGEFVSMGLLPEVAQDIGVSIPIAGQMISAYALGVVVGTPILAVLAARWPRRTLLIALMALYAAGNFATAMGHSYLAVILLRFITGLPHGTYFGVAALVASGIAPPNQRARAVGYVMLGLTVALLIGLPLATWLGQQFGWQTAFVLVGVIALLATMLIRLHVPDLPADPDAHPLRELGAFRRPEVWVTLGIAGIGFGGMFCVFSFIKPTLIAVTGLTLAQVPMIMVLFGFGGIAGNLVGARLADHALMKTIGGTLIYSAILLACFGTLAHTLPGALFGVFLLGTTVALGPAIQIRLMDVAGDAQTLAAALNHSAFNFANALGPALGGLAIAAGWGWTSLGWIGAMLALGGLAMFGVACRMDRAGIRRTEMATE